MSILQSPVAKKPSRWCFQFLRNVPNAYQAKFTPRSYQYFVINVSSSYPVLSFLHSQRFTIFKNFEKHLMVSQLLTQCTLYFVYSFSLLSDQSRYSLSYTKTKNLLKRLSVFLFVLFQKVHSIWVKKE